MIKRTALVLCLVGATAPVLANICATDATPAATLLFPFVPFDFTPGPSMYSDPPVDRTDTIISITNMSSEAQVVRVSLWTDVGVSYFGFYVLLTGYDMVTFSMSDIFIDGQLPVTVNSGHTEFEGVFSNGPVSENSALGGAWVGGLLPEPEATNALGARCSPSDSHYPGNYVNPIPQSLLLLYQIYLESSQVATRYHSDDCDPPLGGGYTMGSWFDERDLDDHVWMYLTADVVETCNGAGPASGGYFSTVSRTDNVLVGQVTWLFPPFITASGQAVHLEADLDLGAVVPEGFLGYPRSFYSRFANTDLTSDYREPLPTAWAVPYHFGGGAGETSLVAWKGSTLWLYPYDLDFSPRTANPDTMIASNCLPYTYYAWDGDENVSSSGVGVRPNLLPLAIQEVPIENFDIVDAEGWLLFVFPHANFPRITPPDYYQTWIGAFHSFGPSKSFLPGNPVANSNCYEGQMLPWLGVNFDYVDSGGYVPGTAAPKAAD